MMAGCCFGAVCDLPWAVSFPGHSPASDAQFKEHLLPSAHLWSLRVHPTQLYESAASLAIAATCLLWVHGRKRYDGRGVLRRFSPATPSSAPRSRSFVATTGEGSSGFRRRSS